jgi:hypothetical protein
MKCEKRCVWGKKVETSALEERKTITNKTEDRKAVFYTNGNSKWKRQRETEIYTERDIQRYAESGRRTREREREKHNSNLSVPLPLPLSLYAQI